MSPLLFDLLLIANAAVHFDAGSDVPPPPPPGHHQPPPEAIEACASLTIDAACSFKLHDHDITGKCKTRPDDSSQLECRPDRLPPPPPAS